MTHVFKHILVTLVAITGVAYAQVDAGVPVPDAAPQQIEEPEPAFAPDQVSGLVESRDPGDSGGRQVGRVMLYPLRGLWFGLWAPVRGFAWAYDRYAIPNRVRRIFFSEDGRVGLFPVLAYKSGFGATVGARLEVRDVLAPDSRLRLTATYLGEVLQAYILEHRSGELLGDRVELDTHVGFETFPRSRFFGIGNGDQQIAGTLMNVNPLVDDAAVGTVYYHDAFTAQLALSADVPGPLRVQVSGGYRLRDFDDDFDDEDDGDDRYELDDDDLEISDVYDPAALVGFQQNLSNVYVEAAVVLDTLRQDRFYLSQATPSAGWLARAKVGYASGLDDDPSAYMRWGLAVQRNLDLYGGDRILVLRAAVEGVSGSLSDVPFVDLPRLGGPSLLRGYQQDRFRDRQAGVASVEYQWGIDRNVSAFVFTDAGRVWRNHDDFTTGHVRVGFGGGVTLHSMKRFLARVMVTSSKDGDAFLTLSFDPVFEEAR